MVKFGWNLIPRGLLLAFGVDSRVSSVAAGTQNTSNKSAQKSAYELSTRPAATLLTLKSTPKANSRPPGIKSQPNLTTARVKGQKVSLKKS